MKRLRRLQVPRIQNYDALTLVQREFELLYYSFSGARIFFRDAVPKAEAEQKEGPSEQQPGSAHTRGVHRIDSYEPGAPDAVDGEGPGAPQAGGGVEVSPATPVPVSAPAPSGVVPPVRHCGNGNVCSWIAAGPTDARWYPTSTTPPIIDMTSEINENEISKKTTLHC